MEKKDSLMKMHDNPINNLQVWQKLPNPADKSENLFPLKPLYAFFQIRHGGDPLLAALNIAESPG